jgi:hypothetical protein
MCDDTDQDNAGQFSKRAAGRNVARDTLVAIKTNEKQETRQQQDE